MTIGYRTVRNLLAIGIVFIPFTALRIGPVGIGELSLITTLFLLLKLNNWKLNPLSATAPVLFFWIAYPTWIVIGFGYNVFVLGYSSGDMLYAAFDQIAYLFVLVLVIVLGDRNLYRGESPVIYFERIFFYWALVFSVLFALSQVTPAIFGFPLLYHDYFSPLVNNVHQSAMIVSAMPYVMLFLGYQASTTKKKFLCFSFAALFVFMALASGSTKAWLAVLAGALASFSLIIIHKPTGPARMVRNAATYMLTAATLVFLFVSYWSVIVTTGVEFFRDQDGQGARERFYTHAIYHSMENPIFGYGPGPHIINGDRFWDAHNTALTILLQGGVVAMVLFLVLFLRIFFRASASSALIGVIAAIGIYTLGGDVLRRLPIWIIILGVLIFSARGHGSLRSKIAIEGGAQR